MEEYKANYITEIKYLRPADESGYPFDLPVLKHFSSIRLEKPVTFITGENGSGKSTLIEAVALAWGFNAEGGSKNFSFATFNSASCLFQHISLVKRGRPKDGFFLRAESLYTVATEIDKLDISGAYGGKSLHEQSHGESFMALMENRFFGNGLYILDEPEAALSAQRQYAMLFRLHELVKKNSQLIISTHSPILLSYPHAVILSIGEDGLRETAYEDCEQYRFTKDFLNSHAQYTKHLDG